MTKKSFVTGAAILGVAGLFVKIMGFIFRIPLVNLIKSDAMAYYNPAYYIYVFFVTLATTGFPVAISRMVSERVTVNDYVEADRVFKLSKRLMLGIGIVTFVIVFFGADKIAELMHVPGAALAMRFISPCLIIIPLLAAYRGFFQGLQNMKPTALSQIVEQLFRVVFGLTLAYIMFKSVGGLFSGYDKFIRGAAGAAFGGTAGAVGGLALILLIYFLNRKAFDYHIRHSCKGKRETNGKLYKQILAISIPITIGASIMPFVNMVDASLIVRRLEVAGFDYVLSKELYGGYTSMVNSMINFPYAITMAVAMSLVPLIAAAYKANDRKYAEDNIQLSLRFSMLISMPCAVGYIVLARPILLMLFPGDAEVASMVAPSFAIAGISVVMLATTQAMTGILQGIGKQNIPVIVMLFGMAAKISCTWFVIAVPEIGIKGAAIGSVAAYTISAVCDMAAVSKFTKVRFDLVSGVLRPFASAAVMGAAAFGVYKGMMALVGSNTVSTLLGIMIGAMVYVVMIFLTGAVSVEDLSKMPKGNKIISLIEKLPAKGILVKLSDSARKAEMAEVHEEDEDAEEMDFYISSEMGTPVTAGTADKSVENAVETADRNKE